MGTSAPTRPAEGGTAPADVGARPPRQGGRQAPDVPAAPGPASGVRSRLRATFRLPMPGDPAPHPARLVGVCAWAAALGLFGLPVAGRASVAIIVGQAPWWFEPTVLAVGLLGIGVTVAAFAAIHRPRLPLLLCAGATAALLINITVTILAL